LSQDGASSKSETEEEEFFDCDDDEDNEMEVDDNDEDDEKEKQEVPHWLLFHYFFLIFQKFHASDEIYSILICSYLKEMIIPNKNYLLIFFPHFQIIVSGSAHCKR